MVRRSHFPAESEALKLIFDGQGCTTGTVVDLTETSQRVLINWHILQGEQVVIALRQDNWGQLSEPWTDEVFSESNTNTYCNL